MLAAGSIARKMEDVDASPNLTEPNARGMEEDLESLRLPATYAA